MKLLKRVAFTCVLVFSAQMANAQIETPQGTGYVGLLGGFADTTNVDGTAGYGLTVGLMFPSGWNGSLWAFNSTAENVGTDVHLFQYGLGADYSLKGFFGDVLATLRGGIKIGSSTVDVDAPGVDSKTEFAFGPSLGTDWMLTEAFSLGAEADLLFVTTGDGYSTLYLFATGKYWF